MKKRFVLIVLASLTLLSACGPEEKSGTITYTFHEGNLQHQVPLHYTTLTTGIFHKESSTTFDYDSFKDEFTQKLQTVQRTDSEPAQLTASCDYIPPVYGNQLQLDSLWEDIKPKLQKQREFDLTTYYIQPDLTHDTEYKDFSETVHNFTLTWDNGSSISADDCQFTLSDNSPLSVSINEAMIRERLVPQINAYDTAGQMTLEFTNVNGTTKTISGGTWGNIVDTQAELNYAIQQAVSLNSVTNRHPTMKQEMATNIPDIRVEVDLTNQKVYYVKNNQVTLSSNCVTGRAHDRATPTGIYFVSEKRKEKDLRGPGYVSHVHRWMRLTNSGVGLHDATWRGRFGGNIYISDGSHGCINLPTQFAYELYDSIDTGVCVVVFK